MLSSDPRAKERARARALLATITQEEDAAITAAAKRDPDNPPITDMAGFQPTHDVVTAHKKRRGPKTGAAGAKKLVSLRIDPDVLEHFRAGGPGWQVRINAALRDAAETSIHKRTASRSRAA